MTEAQHAVPPDRHIVLGAPATAVLEQMGIRVEQVRASLGAYLNEEMA